MARITLAIASDFHCHHSSEGDRGSLLLSDAMRVPPEQHPIASLERLISEHRLTADVVLFPGDFADKASAQGLLSGWDYAQSIKRALNAPSAVATVGNHDIDSYKVHGGGVFEVVRRVDVHFPTASEAEASDYWGRGFYHVDAPDLRILVINTVFNCTDSALAKRGEVTSVQLSELQAWLESTSFDGLQVALMHHHPIPHANTDLADDDLLNRGEDLLRLLQQHGYDLVIHGHKHYPRLRYAPNGMDAIPVLAAGSLSANLQGIFGPALNTFHIVTLDSKELPNCSTTGAVLTWMFQLGRGWQAAITAAAGFPHVTGFGYRGRIADLVVRCQSALQGRKSSMASWEDLKAEVPELSYLVPSDYDALLGECRRRGVEIYHAAGSPTPSIVGLP